MTNTHETGVRIEYPLDGCALLTLDRPAVKNAMSVAMRRELVRLFADDLPRRARVVMLTGSGSAFCAGLDLRELGAAADPGALVSAPELDVVRAMRACPVPVIGLINGAAITGGFELALACDILLASTAARFADTHARIGILPAWGLSQVLARKIGEGRAKELSFTGNFLDARRALEWGLVNAIYPEEELRAAGLKLAADMLSTLPDALCAYKALIDDGLRLPLGAALELEQARALAWAGQLSASDLAQRRGDVVERGRLQAAPDDAKK